MSANDQPSFNLPFNFSNLALSLTSEKNLIGRDGAELSNVTPTNATNLFSEDTGDVTADSEASWVNLVASTNVSSWTHDREFRERNKSLRNIYEEEGLDYGNDVTAAELKSRMSIAVKLRQDSVAKMFKILNASRNIQLCFLVDVTGSMVGHIKGVRDSIFKIVEKLTTAGPGVIAKKVSLSFVGYRDFGYENQFELQSFTENAKIFRQFCSAIQTPLPKTQADAPEDVFGGLEKAIFDLNWSDILTCTKIIFHIADQPCHGKKYHTSDYNWPDLYPDGDPNGRTAESLFNTLREKGIQISGGYLMVVDLEGIMSTDENGRPILELTDPAIHCTDMTRFGRTNMGPEGMKIFFARHKCNQFCQGMKLEEHQPTTS